MSERLRLTNTGEVDKPPETDAGDRRIPSLGEESGDMTAEETPSISRTNGKLCWNTTSASATISLSFRNQFQFHNKIDSNSLITCVRSIFWQFQSSRFFSSLRVKLSDSFAFLCNIYDEEVELWVTGCNRWMFCTRGGHGSQSENGI